MSNRKIVTFLEIPEQGKSVHFQDVNGVIGTSSIVQSINFHNGYYEILTISGSVYIGEVNNNSVIIGSNNSINSSYKYPNKTNCKNHLTAILLCFFLGNLGIHKYYLREYDIGLLYSVAWSIATIISLFSILSYGFLFIYWNIISSFIYIIISIFVLIDIIRLIIMNDIEFNWRYNR